MERLLAQAPDMDAVFVASDLMAAGRADRPARAGPAGAGGRRGGRLRRLHRGVSATPALTTIRQPLDRISAEMVRLLLARSAARSRRR